MSKANERETLGGILAIGGGSYGVSASKVSLRMTLQDGHKVTTSFDGVVTDCSDDNIKEAMQTLETDELVGIDVRFKLSKSNPSCVIDDPEKIDAAYKTVVQEIKIDKKRITDDLKHGIPVEGAYLQESFSLRQYANSPATKGAK